MCASTTRNHAKTNSTGKTESDLPTNLVARTWVRLYRAVPRINFPFTRFDVSITLCSALFLYAVRLLSGVILVNGFGWPEVAPGTNESMGSITAAVHALHLVPGLFVALTTQPYSPSAHMSTAPQWWQDLVTTLLQVCTGYMIYDSLASFVFLKGISNLDGTDFMFLGHHAATAVYMTQARVLQAGHTSAMICMFLGEFTNPLQNGNVVTGHAMELACCNGALMQQIHYVIEFLFVFFYFTIRAFIAPIFFAHVTFDLVFSKTRTNIPLGLRIAWIAMIWGVEIGSYAWIVNCGQTLQIYLGVDLGLGSGVTDEL